MKRQKEKQQDAREQLLETVEEGFCLIGPRHHNSTHTARSKISDKRDCVTVSTLGIYSRKGSKENQGDFQFNKEEKEEETKEYTNANEESKEPASMLQ